KWEDCVVFDLPEGDRRAIGSLELGIAADVDTLEVARTHLVDHRERAFAEVATLGAVDDDSRDRGPGWSSPRRRAAPRARRRPSACSSCEQPWSRTSRGTPA